MRRSFPFQPSSFFLLFVLVAFITSQRVSAQSTTGSIYGRVTDPSGAVVPGAQVTATGESTGVRYPGESDADGNYTIYGLPPSRYSVDVRKEGFQTASIKSVLIAIDQKQLLDFELKVGAASEVMTVTEVPTLLQTQSAEEGDVIQSQDILNLPLLGRDFSELTQYSAGVVAAGGSINHFSYSIGGQREYANSIQIDGLEGTTNRSGDITVQPSVDSVEEFKVSTSGYDAEFGRSAGGIVSIQTKAGSNQWHGSAYEFFRPNFTTAKNFGFNGEYVPPSILKQHNYGGTLGGPIFKDKTFFFASYEGLYSAQAYDYVYAVPPVSQVTVNPDGSVDLTRLVDPFLGTQIPIYDPEVSIDCYGGCYQQISYNGVYNVIPPDRVSQAGLNTLMNFFPAPNLAGIDNGWYDNFAVHSPVTYHAKTADARLDHNFSSKDRLSVVFHYNNSDSLTTDPFHGQTPVAGAGDADQANYQTDVSEEYAVTETHLFSNRVINEFRVGYTRFNLAQFSLLNGHDYSTEFGMANIAVDGLPSTDAYPYIYLGAGYLTGGSTYKPLFFKDRNWQFVDNLVVSGVGKHEFKFGADFRRLKSNPNFSLFPTGFQYYGGPYLSMTSDWSYTSPLDNYSALYGTGGADLADLLMGLPLDHYMGLQLTNPYTQSWEMEYYAQDTFKLTPRFTLNYGIRYEFQAPYTEEHNLASNYVPNPNGDASVGGTILLAGLGGNSRSLVNSRRNQFAPRFGFAYQITPRTVLRGGGGIFYSPENDAREDLLTKNLPFAIQQQWTNIPYNGPCYASECNGVYSYQIDQAFPRISTPPIPEGASSIPASSVPSLIPNGNSETTFYVDSNLKTGYSEDFNLALQRELGSNFTVEAAYVGARGHHLSYEVGDLNMDLATQSDGLIDSNLGQIQGLTDRGLSYYNSLQVKVTKRVSPNLNFLTNWTYSHAIDNGPAPFDLGHINSDNPQNAYQLFAELASSDFDVRHTFNFSGLYHLPVGHGQRWLGNVGKAGDLIAGGWQLNGIFAMRTGRPVNVIANGSNNSCPGVRPDLIGDPNIPNGDRTLLKYFNTEAFAPPMGGGCNPGDTARNILTGPGYINADVSMFKEFAITEKVRLETRFEFFNALNTPHFANPNSDLGSSTSFGQITRQAGSGRDNRIVQFAAKLIF